MFCENSYVREAYILVVIEVSKATGIPEKELIKKFEETGFTEFLLIYPDSVVMMKNTEKMVKMVMEYLECNGKNELFDDIREYYYY